MALDMLQKELHSWIVNCSTGSFRIRYCHGFCKVPVDGREFSRPDVSVNGLNPGI